VSRGPLQVPVRRSWASPELDIGAPSEGVDVFLRAQRVRFRLLGEMLTMPPDMFVAVCAAFAIGPCSPTGDLTDYPKRVGTFDVETT